MIVICAFGFRMESNLGEQYAATGVWLKVQLCSARFLVLNLSNHCDFNYRKTKHFCHGRHLVYNTYKEYN